MFISKFSFDLFVKEFCSDLNEGLRLLLQNNFLPLLLLLLLHHHYHIHLHSLLNHYHHSYHSHPHSLDIHLKTTLSSYSLE
jgi:hypothetical protein